MANEARSLKAFGIAGSLRDDCTVYYTSDYRSRNIGRFTDLMAAKLREVDADEMRVRALLLFSLYESYAALGKTFRSQSEAPPISLEIGFDRDQLAIGVSFHWKEGRSPIIAGVAQRVPQGVLQNPFEEILSFLRQYCSKLVVKHEARERRIEILTLLDRNDGDRRDPMEVVEVDSATAPYMEASQYIEMGDLDYLALTGEQRLEPALEVTGDENILMNTDLAEPDADSRLAGSDATDEAAAVAVFEGDPAEEAEESVRLMKSANDEIEALKQRIRDLEHAKNPEADVSKDEDSWGGLSFLKQMWPFGDEVSAPAEGAQDHASAAAPVETSAVVVPGSEISEDVVTLKVLGELESLASAKTGGVAFQKVVQEITADVDPEKSKRWVDGLMSEVVKEKARLAELARDLTKQSRQRELDFKSRERTLLTEVARISDESKRKESLLERNREQIAQLNLALERGKAIGSALDDQAVKLRLNNAQKLAQTKDEESRALAAKVKSLEDRLIVAQARSSRPAVDPQMVARLQTAERKVEEMKRLNQRLTDHLNAAKPASADKDIIAVRRKLETSERQMQELKKSLEKAQFRVREMQESERKMQIDMQKAIDENRKLRGSRSGESGGQAA